jgi:NADH-quinone oxidoreductase subunit H
LDVLVGLKNVVLVLVFLLSLILSAATLTVFERQVLGSIQHRKGPNVMGFLGLFQPIADALKLLVKEPIVPLKAETWLFIFSSILLLGLSLLLWGVMPFYGKAALLDINIALLYVFSISSLSIYGVILAGWASNSRYAFLGSLRACAQMLSYELVLSMVIFLFLICAGSTTINSIVDAQQDIWFGVIFFPLLILFIICAIAETNRAPFDLPEAESESVSGYNLDYSSIIFAFFFLAEYLHILLMSNLIVILFLGGWLPVSVTLFTMVDFLNGGGFISNIYNFFLINFCVVDFSYFWYSLKLIIIVYLFIWIRSSLPRFRYDQLMVFGWKILIPLVLGLVFFYIGIVYLYVFLI